MRQSAKLIIIAIILHTFSACAWLRPQDPVAPDIAKQIMITIAIGDQQSVHLMGYQAEDEATTESTGKVIDVEKIARSIAKEHGLKLVSISPIEVLGVQCVVLEIKDERTTEQVLAALGNEKLIESMQTVSSYKLLTYNDPYFHLQSTVSIDGLEQVHEWATGKGVVVAIIDTGLDTRHPELQSKIVYSGNFVSHDQQKFDDDEHGTAVAGVIAATANNDLGIVGMAPDVKLMALKACWHENKGSSSRCDSFSLVKALVKALELEPDILNLSLSGPIDPLIARLVKRASGQGMIIVGAVDQAVGMKHSFPANMVEVIAVTAPPIGHLDSSWGVSFLAPGIDILTTAPGSAYAFESGSSMATAHVSGVAALIKEKDPALSGESARELLSHTAQVWDMVPVIDICAAIAQLNEEPVCTAKAVVQVTDVRQNNFTE
jgi:subtilisin family serine protease